MNERTIELFKQANKEAYELCKKHGHDVGEIDTTWVSIMSGKLIEMIVQECMSVADLPNNASGQWDHLLSSEVIGKHFGVEE